MFTKFLSATAVALAATTLVSAQTFTSCDPTKKDCPPDPALGTSVTIDFTKGKDESVLKGLAGTEVTYDGTNGAVFTINKETEAPTMATSKYIFFGRLDVEVQAAKGAGIVTSVVLQSDDLDEIDWEWVGNDDAQVQTNYFYKGDTTTYDRGKYHPVANPTTQFHTYSIEWTSESVVWSINGAPIRTLNLADVGAAKYPQTPCQVKIGTWVAGRKDAPKGTVDWAGGYTNFAEAPFVGYYRKITITDYAGGKGPGQAVQGAKQYVYGDKSGNWQSIKVETTGGDTKPDDEVKHSTTAIPTKSANSASDDETKTTLSTITTSSASVNTNTTTSASTSASTTATGSTSRSTTPSGTGAAAATTTTGVPGAGAITQANLALGVAGLFLAFLL